MSFHPSLPRVPPFPVPDSRDREQQREFDTAARGFRRAAERALRSKNGERIAVTLDSMLRKCPAGLAHVGQLLHCGGQPDGDPGRRVLFDMATYAVKFGRRDLGLLVGRFLRAHFGNDALTGADGAHLLALAARSRRLARRHARVAVARYESRGVVPPRELVVLARGGTAATAKRTSPGSIPAIPARARSPQNCADFVPPPDGWRLKPGWIEFYVAADRSGHFQCVTPDGERLTSPRITSAARIELAQWILHAIDESTNVEPKKRVVKAHLQTAVKDLNSLKRHVCELMAFALPKAIKPKDALQWETRSGAMEWHWPNHVRLMACFRP